MESGLKFPLLKVESARATVRRLTARAGAQATVVDHISYSIWARENITDIVIWISENVIKTPENLLATKTLDQSLTKKKKSYDQKNPILTPYLLLPTN